MKINPTQKNCKYFFKKFFFRNKKQKSFSEALEEIKDKNILCVGLIDSFYSAVLNIFIFSWTPLLQNSTDMSNINVGFIYIVFVVFSLIGASFYDIFVIIIKADYMKLIIVSLSLEISLFGLVYFVEDFTLRLIFLSTINVRKFLLNLFRELRHFLYR